MYSVFRMSFRASGLVAAFCGALACSKPAATPDVAESDPGPPLEVQVAAVGRGAVQRVVRATGTMFGDDQTTVAAKVSGRVEAVYRDVGDEVKPGDPLVRIESTDYELALAERRRALEQTLAQIGLEALPEAEFSVERLPAVERARLQSENAKARFERGQLLHGRSPPTMSDQEFADLETTWEVAQADHRLAALNARAQLAAARTLKAQLETAEQRLADTLHSVPSGVRPAPAVPESIANPVRNYAVTARLVSVGDYVQIAAPMFELIDPDPLELRVKLPEREIARVHGGQRVTLSVEAYAESFEGRVARINPGIDVRSRTFEVEIAVPNADRRLRAGSFAKLAIEAELEEGVLLVPRTAVTVFAGVPKVFVVVDGKAVERVVTLGQEVDTQVEIVKGLEDSDTIVTAPPTELTVGTRVRAATVSADRAEGAGAKAR
jgi:multidrug efflux pump subunit AcrA (membrane-fusion protein)